jgi:DedD protein
MANTAPESEFDLKKRLLGALILIGFGVVVLPALLGGKDPQGGVDGSQQFPSLESKVFVSKITPIGGETPQPMPKPQQTKPRDGLIESQAPTPDPVVPVKPEVKKKKIAKSDPPAKTKSAPKAEAKPVTRPKDEPGWVVRVGTFNKKDNANRVVKRLQQAGFSPSTTKIKTDKGLATRVWVGPYAQRVEAARIRTRVQQVTGGEEGYIAAYP